MKNIVLAGSAMKKVGTIREGKVNAVRAILKMQKPDDGKEGKDYNSKDWVKLVLDWCCDNEAFVWGKDGKSIVESLPKG